MRELEHIASSPASPKAGRRSPRTSVIVSLLAATFVIGSIAPSFAFNGMGQTSTHGRPHRGHVADSAVRHHEHHEHQTRAYRGSRLTGFRAAPNLVHGGAALGAGLAGLAAGAMADEAAYPVDPAENAVNYCANRFKSYDPSSGTYMGYDGYEHPCP